MENCNTCIFYDKNYDERKQMFDDTNLSDNVWHHCSMYDDVIPGQIWANKTQCEFHASFDKKGEADG